MNILAIVDDANSPIRRIPLTGSIQNEVSEFFLRQKENFCVDKEKVDFTGSYNVDIREEVLRISNYSIEDELTNSLQNPLSYDILNLREESLRIMALLAGEWNDEKYICFQVFDSRKVLDKGFTLIHSQNTYTKLQDPGIILQDKLTALFEEDELLFYSYYNTRRFLDLSNYYKEATDSDLDAFVDNDLFEVENKDLFKYNSDSIIRKRIALLQKNNVLGNLGIDDIRRTAQEYGVSINIENSKIVIPDNRKELKKFIRFLDEDYFTAPLTKRKCITNSKQYLPR